MLFCRLKLGFPKSIHQLSNNCWIIVRQTSNHEIADHRMLPDRLFDL